MTVASSSGPAQHEATLDFGQVNLLAERISQHEANCRQSRRAVRGLAACLALSLAVLPYLALRNRSFSDALQTKARAAGIAQKAVSVRATQVADLAPAINYLQRREIAAGHLERWRSLLALLENSCGPGGVVSHVQLHQSPGTVDVQVDGEAADLATVTRLGGALQDSQATRDLRITDVKKPEILDEASGAVSYSIKGKVKLQ